MKHLAVSAKARTVAARCHKALSLWRQSANLTQVEVGGALGVSHTTVQRWESGVNAIALESLVLIADLYGAGHPGALLNAPHDFIAVAVATVDPGQRLTLEQRRELAAMIQWFVDRHTASNAQSTG